LLKELFNAPILIIYGRERFTPSLLIRDFYVVAATAATVVGAAALAWSCQ